MPEKMPDPSKYDTLEDTSAYARPIEDFGKSEVSSDHLANLLKLRAMLIKKRRYMAQDVVAYPVVYQARAQDIMRLQQMLSALKEAIAEEQELALVGEESATKN